MIIKPAIHKFGNGKAVSKLRLIADEGKALTTDGLEFWTCVDVDEITGWTEVDAPIEEEQLI